MPQRKVWDLTEVESLAARHETSEAVMKGLYTNTATLNKALRTNEEFRAAYNRGRERGGFRVYAPRGEKSDESPKLDPDAREVLEALQDCKAGLTLKEIQSATAQTPLAVSNAIRTLGRHQLIRSDGGLNYFANGTNGHARATSRTPRTPKTNQPGKETNSPAGEDLDQPISAAPPPDATTTKTIAARIETFANLNGHTSTARALESARVELLYQRIHGEPSPKAADVIERVEEELGNLVANAAGA